MFWFDTPSKTAIPTVEQHPLVDRHRVRVEAVQIAAVGGDLALVWLAAAAARMSWSDGPISLVDAVSVSSLSALIVGAVFALIAGIFRAYSVGALSDARRQAKSVAAAWLLTFFVLGWGVFLAKSSSDFSRGAISLQFVFGFILLEAYHVGGATMLGRSFAKGFLSLRRVALIAVADDVEVASIRRRLRRKGIEVVDATPIPRPALDDTSYASHCFAAASDARVALARVKLDGIYLFTPWHDRRALEGLRTALGPLPVPVFLFADRETQAVIERPEVKIAGLRGFEVQRAPLSRSDRMIKRAMDLAVAGGALVLLSPLMGLTAIGILLETGRPVLFRQTRRGFGARPFQILKFRSMTVQENGSKVTQATRGDARVTRLGRILRKTSIDELPQLFNVLSGEMSIVGPRPHAVAHDDYYDGLIATYAFRQHVKPGITGWAQVCGHRGETREVEQMSARVEHDLWYIDHWSPWLDVEIIFKTALKVLTDEGAY